MRVKSKGLRKALKDFPRRTAKNLELAIIKSVNEGVGFAKVMVPRGTGDLAAGIHAKFESGDGIFKGSVEAAAPEKEPQRKALAVEFGRRKESTPSRGTTEPVPYIRRAQAIIAPKHKGRITRAINKAKKEVGLK